jgi:hypothetical protein
MPYIEAPDRRGARAARGRGKPSADERKLQAAHALSVEQYAKRRHAIPPEVRSACQAVNVTQMQLLGAEPIEPTCRSLTAELGHSKLHAEAARAAPPSCHHINVREQAHAVSLRAKGRSTMDIDDSEREEVVLRLDADAFAVHARHAHCVDFIATAQGAECALVRRLPPLLLELCPCGLVTAFSYRLWGVLLPARAAHARRPWYLYTSVLLVPMHLPCATACFKYTC